MIADSFPALYIMVSIGQLDTEALKKTSERPSSEQDSHNLWTRLPKIHGMMRAVAKRHIGTLRQHSVDLDPLSHIHGFMSKTSAVLKELTGRGQ